MTEYFINFCLGWSSYFLVTSFLLGAAIKYKAKWAYKYCIGVYLLSAILVATSPSITYKNTTHYNKEADIKSITATEIEVDIRTIEDKVLRPDQTKEERKKEFEDLIKY